MDMDTFFVIFFGVLYWINLVLMVMTYHYKASHASLSKILDDHVALVAQEAAKRTPEEWLFEMEVCRSLNVVSRSWDGYDLWWKKVTE